jgi:hypothetical protein
VNDVQERFCCTNCILMEMNTFRFSVVHLLELYFVWFEAGPYDYWFEPPELLVEGL